MSTDRKAELARKKAKLEALKKRRQARQAEKDSGPSGSPARTYVGVNVEDLVSKVLAETDGGTPGRLAVPQEDGGLGSVSSSASPIKHTSLIRQRLRMAHMAMSDINHVSIVPAEKIAYQRATQTDFPEAQYTKPDEDKGSGEDEGEEQRKQEEKAAAEAVQATTQVQQEEEPPKREMMTDTEAAEVLVAPDFMEFFDKSSRLVERALHQPYDVLIDYAAQPDQEESDNAPAESVKLGVEFHHERYSANRAVTCMDWSPQHPELLAVAYNSNPDAPSDPDGIVMVWNLHLPERPEFIFECQSAVLSTCFSPFQPNVVVGGTYSGQVVLWDNRAKRTPVQRSSLSAKSHTHPVYCSQIVGTQNAHNLITISTDGKLCSWNLDMLTTPQETLDLNSGTSKPIAATCLSFPSGDINQFVVGSEEGALYAASRHGAKAGTVETYEKHAGPVTGVDFHMGSSDFSHLFLSSSTDWTVKLWSFRSTTPLYSFENAGDYVYDVQWSPTHPALFASVDGMGHMDFWNLNIDTEVPIVTTEVAEGRQALNRVQWNVNGHQLAVGAANGSVYVYNVGEKLSVPRTGEAQRLKETLSDIQHAQAEAAAAAGATTLAR